MVAVKGMHAAVHGLRKSYGITRDHVVRGHQGISILSPEMPAPKPVMSQRQVWHIERWERKKERMA